jgi:hypothetical protein
MQTHRPRQGSSYRASILTRRSAWRASRSGGKRSWVSGATDTAYSSISLQVCHQTLLNSSPTPRTLVSPPIIHSAPTQPYVVGCLSGGGDLTVTVLYLTMLARAKSGKERGGLVHVQLDNTCSECKCVVVLAFLCWLVHTGRYRRARLFFMEVGHTKTNLDRAGV